MEEHEHRVLYSLDKPVRILTWTIPEFLCLSVPVVLGFLCDALGVGLGLGVVCYGAWTRLGRRMGQVSRWMYWVVPVVRLRCAPPSWIRLIGM